jgi:riboflavin synthase
MFTGLAEEIGLIQNIHHENNGLRITIQAHAILDGLAIGDSVAVDGVCLTVVGRMAQSFTVEAVAETVQRSTLALRSSGHNVNLERSLLPTSRLGGHFVQGHVDGTGLITECSQRDPGLWLRITVTKNIAALCVEKGSIAIDGVSLTIARLDESEVAIAVIPHTASHTTLGRKREGDAVNIETDVLGKYVYRYLHRSTGKGSLSMDQLAMWGF